VFTAPFTVTATAVDALSGLAACTSATYGGPAANGASVTGSCSDRAGNRVMWSYSFDYDPPQLLTLSSGSTRLTAGSPIIQAAVLEGCEVSASGKLLANGRTTDIVALATPGRDACSAGLSVVSGSISEDRLSGTGKLELLASGPLRVTTQAISGFVLGSCTYEYSKFEGTFSGGQTSGIPASGTGNLVEQTILGTCPQARSAHLTLTLADPTTGVPLTGLVVSG
jgi:hypothetical protein